VFVRIVSVILLLAIAGGAFAAEPAKAVCDVCREGEEPVVARIDHGAHVHSFCSEACAAAFRADPAKCKASPLAKARPASDEGAGSAAPSCPV
jgi:hypothetical protein